MTEKTEWEVIDAPAPAARETLRQLLARLLGPWWRWKVVGGLTLAGVALAALAALAGIVVIFMAAAALVSIAVAKTMHWLRGWHASYPDREHPVGIRK